MDVLFSKAPACKTLAIYTISFLTALLHVLLVLRVWPTSHGLLKPVSQTALPTSEWI